ncbi:MAG: SDR family oxidoreductase [Spirochaetales bacterium]|nr:SDR family oxidoreductase [Spirochaetales bacterium]
MKVNHNAGNFLNLKGKTAVVTGGGVNIGKAISIGLASLGVKVALVYNSSSTGADSTAGEINEAGGTAVPFQADISDENQVERLFKEISAEPGLGRVDILVNNSGIFSSYDQTELPTEEWDRIFNINVRGTFLCTREAARKMKEQNPQGDDIYRGTIINMVSINAFHPGFGQTVHYDASKGAVQAFTRSLAAELGPYGIRVNGVAPGLVDSQGLRAGAGELATMVEKQNPLSHADRSKSLVKPQNVADTIVYLASSLSWAVTGETIIVDRGFLLT